MMAPQASKIFRQAALDRLSSPEQLDRTVEVLKARDWIGVVATSAVLGLAIIWSVFGIVPTRVSGSGIVTATGGHVVDAVSTAGGLVREITVSVGSTVAKGEVVARVEQPDLRQQLSVAQATASAQEVELATLRAQTAKSIEALASSIGARKILLGAQIRDAETQATLIEAELAKQSEMFDRHLITLQKLSDTRQSLIMTRQRILEARSQISQAEAEEVAQRNANDREVRAAAGKLEEARKRVSTLEEQVHAQEDIASPVAGRVTEWKIAPGGRAAPGTALVSVETGVTGLELQLYLPPDEGKQVRPGMDVKIALSTVKREEFGTMVGKVIEVSDFPATPQAMLATLQNDRLVQQLSPKGPPFAARVELIPDPSTPSGYHWAGGIGPNIRLSSGTLADGEVTVTERPPIFYVLPWLKKITGLSE